MTGRWNWRVAARCRTVDAEGLFVTGARQREAREFCRTCPVRTECLAHALDQRIEFGVWGGMTERERRALLRARPEVQSWADLLADARTAHYSSAAEESADALARASERESAQLEESA
jgi:WhiB family redox-sensing transcriptional regulator